MDKDPANIWYKKSQDEVQKIKRNLEKLSQNSEFKKALETKNYLKHKKSFDNLVGLLNKEAIVKHRPGRWRDITLLLLREIIGLCNELNRKERKDLETERTFSSAFQQPSP